MQEYSHLSTCLYTEGHVSTTLIVTPPDIFPSVYHSLFICKTMMMTMILNQIRNIFYYNGKWKFRIEFFSAAKLSCNQPNHTFMWVSSTCIYIYEYINITLIQANTPLNKFKCLLLLISMLRHRQAIFESKGDKLSSSAECRIRTQGLRYLFASRLNACWQTDWAIEDQAKKLEPDSPSLWSASIQSTRPHCQLAFAPGSGDIRLCCLKCVYADDLVTKVAPASHKIYQAASVEAFSYCFVYTWVKQCILHWLISSELMQKQKVFVSLKNHHLIMITCISYGNIFAILVPMCINTAHSKPE